jgi:hypothetical protein
MRTGALVVVDIRGKNAAQMALVDHNDMVRRVPLLIEQWSSV